MKIELAGHLFKTEVVRVEKCEDIFKSIFYLSLNDVIYIENYNRKTILVAVGGEFVISAPFGKIKKILADDNFGTGHCSFWINKNCITGFDGAFVILNETHSLPVARRRLKTFKEEWNGGLSTKH